MFAALMLLSFMALQVLVFAFVAIGGRDGLVTLGSALSWVWQEAWRIGGVATVPVFTSIVILTLSASVIALHRGSWIALPRPAFAWALRGRRYAARVALVSALVQIVLSLQPFGTDLGAALPQDGIVTPANATTLMYGSSLAGAGVLILVGIAHGLRTGRPSGAQRSAHGWAASRVRLVRRSGRCGRRSIRRAIGPVHPRGEACVAAAPALVHA
jgi:hypothetical protein